MIVSKSWCFQSTFRVFVILQCLISVQSAYIPTPRTSRNEPAALFRRAVTYGNTGHDVAKSAICTDGQKKVLERSMGEAVKLAVAGLDAFDIILDMLTDEKTKYRALDRKDQIRIRNTYFTFFGKITKPKEFDWHKKHIGWIKDRLGRLKGLDVASWPKAMKFYCDSSYFQDKDADGKTKDAVSPPKDKKPAKNREWKYDWDQKIWAETYLASDCHRDGGLVAAYTLRLPDDEKDRMTFCPQWFTITAEAGKTFTDLNQNTDINGQDPLSLFARKSARIFLHEHLHSFFVNQADDDVLKDVDGGKSYGAVAAARYGQDDMDKANKNIENVVYWCISMFLDNWDWSTLMAREKSGEEPK